MKNGNTRRERIAIGAVIADQWREDIKIWQSNEKVTNKVDCFLGVLKKTDANLLSDYFVTNFDYLYRLIVEESL